ncbi:MAG TPA: TAXI family TRAP transporter solute-binding subunit, partial [Burkholderiaceae bacterium]|nr:TAXI family TRAP transporter solute-binding subunit [Burkholderiaceae bacterium]
TAYQAYHGQGQFEGRRQVSNTRALASIYPNVIQIVLPGDSDVQSLQDLKGKRVSVGAPGSGTEVNSRAVLESNGITQNDFNAQRLNFNETADALRDGDIDAGLWSVGPPTSSIMSLAATRPIRVLSLTEEERANAIEREPVFASFTMPGGMYEGVDEPVTTLGIPNVLIVNADMPEDLAYDLTKLLFEKKDELVAVHAAAENLSVEFTLDSTPVPLHPGAIRYFEEIGADVPDRLKP